MYTVDWVKSRKGKNEVAVYRVPSSDVAYEFFLKKKLAGDSGAYVCCGCDAIRSRNNREGVRNLFRVPTIKVVAGVFQSDPAAPPSPHFCVPKSSGTVIASRVIDEVVLKMMEEDERMFPKDASTRIVNHLMTSEKFNELPVVEKLVAVVTSTNGPSAAGKASLRRRLQRAQRLKDKMSSFLVVKLPPGADVSDLINQAASESLLFSLCDQPTDVVKFIDDNGDAAPNRTPSASEEVDGGDHPEVKIEPIDADEAISLSSTTTSNLLENLNASIMDVINSQRPSPATAEKGSTDIHSTLLGKRERSRDFECPLCLKPLSSQGLASHLRSHPTLTVDTYLVPSSQEGKELSYRCSKCPRGFLDYKQLRIHEALHIKRPYNCEQCSYKAPDYAKLWAHTLKSHGETEVAQKKAKLEDVTGGEVSNESSTEELVIRGGRVTYEEGPATETTEAENEGGAEEKSPVNVASDLDSSEEPRDSIIDETAQKQPEVDDYYEDTAPDSMETFITVSSTSEDNDFVCDYTTMSSSASPVPAQPQEIQESTS